MINKTKLTIQKYQLIQNGDKVIAAVSGGPDSVCLGYLLAQLRHTLNFSLIIAHLDHNIRGKASRRDADFVCALAKNLEVPFYTQRLKTPPPSEDAARRARYCFLENVRLAQKAQKIAVAHHQDDQVETILLHWLRGAGLQGLSGMQYRRQKIIRPLLDCSRQEILNYLRQNKLSFRKDDSNKEKKFLRNRVRHELLPFLEKRYNPQMRKNLLNLALIAREANNYLGRAARRFLRQNPNFITLRSWQKLPLILQNETLRQALKARAGNLVDIYAGQIQEVAKMLKTPHGNKEKGLPGGLRIFKKNGKIWLNKKTILKS